MQTILLDQIEPNPDQPRKVFDPAAIQELANSIRVDGLLQPITVRPVNGSYQIVAGERRWRALCFLRDYHGGADSIDCQVRDVTELARDITAIVENLLRVDISPLEEADAFGRLVAIGLSAEEIASRTGAHVHRIRQRLLLLNLESGVRKLFEGGHLDKQQATEIARLPKNEQPKLVKMLNRGEIRGWNSIKHAVDVALGVACQDDMFGASAPPVSREEVETLNRMESKVQQVVNMVLTGWRDGECVIANRVNPDRAKVMAQKLELIRSSIRTMERELKHTLAQAAMTLHKEGE